MATDTQNKTDGKHDVFDVDRWNEAARKAGHDYLELYEKAVDRLADLEVKTATATKLPVVASLADAHASVSREIAGAYAAAARDLLKA